MTDTITVTIPTAFGTTETVPGTPVVPGLAITTDLEKPHRQRLTHTPTGKCLPIALCPNHTEVAARVIAAFDGIDWTTGDAEHLAETVQASGLIDRLRDESGLDCDKSCDPTPDGPPWGIRCRTCHWEDESPTTAGEAKDMAHGHVCEPNVQIRPPDGDRWLYPSQIPHTA
jgi:hypothetical protein